MKKLYLVLFAAFPVFISNTSHAQDYDNPVEYMNVISKQRESVSKKFMTYVSASAHGKREKKVESLRSKLLDEVQEARMNINSMPSFKGDKSFRDTAVNFMKLYYNVLNEDYSKIINMEEIAEQSYDAMEAYLMAQEQVDKKLEEGNGKMRLALQAFAAKNNVNLTTNKTELGEMMEQVHVMNVYHHQLYLIFFKPYKQEAYLMEAVEKNNVTGIEQNKSSLLKYAQSGLEKLTGIKPFEGDNSVVIACRSMLNFYVKEVNEKLGAISDYLLTKERFETIKKEFDKKSSPSKEEIDTFNKGVNDINKASQNYNATSQELNQLRKEALDNWNKTVNAFFDEHTPHYK